MSSSGPASAIRLETLCSLGGGGGRSFPRLDLCEVSLKVGLIDEELVGYGETLGDECDELRLATRFSFPTRRRADEFDSKERAEPGEGL